MSPLKLVAFKILYYLSVNLKMLRRPCEMKVGNFEKLHLIVHRVIVRTFRNIIGTNTYFSPGTIHASHLSFLGVWTHLTMVSFCGSWPHLSAVCSSVVSTQP